MKKNYILILILILSSVGRSYSQDKNINWINKNVHPLSSDSAMNALSFLSDELKGNSIIGLGEASHGTKEFFDQKSRIIKYLVTQLNYKSLGFEMHTSTVDSINQYVLNGKGNLKEFVSKMGLYNTKEFFQLFQFIRAYNAKQPAVQKVNVFGFDKPDYAGIPLERDKLMADEVIQAQQKSGNKTIIWSHNVHLAKDTTMANYQGMGYYLKQKFAKNYYGLGFDTYKGSVSVLGEDGFIKHDFVAKEGSFTALFAKAKYPVFFIPFNVKSSPFSGSKNTITNIYSSWKEQTDKSLPIRPGLDFDGLIFIRETTASVKLDLQ